MRLFKALSILSVGFLLSNVGLANASNSLRCMSMNGHWRMASSASTSAEPPLNHGLQRYAYANFGRHVGRGECADIPDTYLRGAGAKTFYQLGPTGTNADYVWGDLVTVARPGSVDLSSVLPGDIVQMRNVQAVFRNGNTTYTQSPTHHTAIVFAIGPDDRDLCVLEQSQGVNINYGWYNLNGLQNGTLWFYRPRY